MNARPPVAFFAYNRPAHAARSLESLAACRGAQDTDLHVFLDGPRSDSNQEQCGQVAAVVLAASGFRSVKVSRSISNKGLFRSITEGVGEILRIHDCVVVVEDDLVVAPGFLDYMAGALAAYANVPEVGCIHAYALPLPDLPDFYFLRGGDCWGWATWRDRWALFRPDPADLLVELSERHGGMLDFMASHGAASLSMLRRRALGQNESWAILWHASLFLADRLTLHPGRSLVSNIGNDGSGTHGADTSRYTPLAKANHVTLSAFAGLSVAQDARAAAMISAYMDGESAESVSAKTRLWLKRMLAEARARWTAKAVAKRIGRRIA